MLLDWVTIRPNRFARTSDHLTNPVTSMENKKTPEDDTELVPVIKPEDDPQLVPVIKVDHGPLGRRVLNFFTGLPSLIPAIKRRRKRKRRVMDLERRRELWRAVKTEAEVPNRVRKTGADPDDWEVDRDREYEIEAGIKYAETKCNTDLSRIKAQIQAIDLYPLAKQADKYRVPVPDTIYTDERNGEKITPTTWLEFLDRRETEMTNTETNKLHQDVQAKRDERRKRRNETLVPVLTVVVQVLTAGAAIASALVALAAVLKK
jgi:hypothetical protein